MKGRLFYAIIGIGAVLVLAIIWWGTHSQSPQKPAASVATSTAPVATSTPSLTGMTIYTNGQYGFSLLYPGTDTATTTFAQYYQLPNAWRVGAPSNASGTPIVAVIGYRTQSDNSYPRYFDAEVRVGASSDQTALKTCTQVGDGEMPQPAVTINGVTWQVFAFQSVGMMQYANGLSYRTIHDHTCYALEQIETGSSYRDDPPSQKDIPDSTLTKQYDALAKIVESFTFAR